MVMAGLWQGKFWLDALDRAVTTAAQVAATMLTINAFGQHIEWKTVGYGSAVAALYSLLTTISRRGGGTPTALPPGMVPQPSSPAPLTIVPPTPEVRECPPPRKPNQW